MVPKWQHTWVTCVSFNGQFAKPIERFLWTWKLINNIYLKGTLISEMTLFLASPSCIMQKQLVWPLNRCIVSVNAKWAETCFPYYQIPSPP